MNCKHLVTFINLLDLRECVECGAVYNPFIEEWEETIGDMTLGQEAHLAEVKDEFTLAVDKKYRAGQQEHGGNLWKKEGIIDMLLEEAVDFYVYAITLKRQLDTGFEEVDPEEVDK